MSDSEFVKHSTIDFLIPQDTDVDIEEALSTAESPADGDETGVLARISQRSLLYFDESLPICVILRTPYQDDESLQRYIPRLNVVLEAQSFSSPSIMSPTAESQAAAQAHDVIWSAKLDVTEDPVFVVVGSGEDEDGQDVLLIWKANAFLARPRVRLQAPAIKFRVSAVLRPPPRETTGAHEAYLPSGVPFAMNVLEPLGDELLLSGAALSPAAVSSAQQATGDSLPLIAVPRRAFRAIPALSSRLRYHRSAGTYLKSSVLATLELDALNFAQHPVELTQIKLSYVGGEEQRMLNAESVHLPLTFEATDNLVCLYAIDSEHANGQAPPIRTFDIAIDARVLISKSSRPHIEIRWRQNIDFTQLSPSAGKLGVQRDHRPASITTGAANAATDLGRPPPNDGVTATFAKSDTVYVGEPFRWQVSIVNRTARVRQFAFAMLPKRPGGQQSRRTTRSTTLVGGGSTARAEAVVDDNILYATIRAHGAEATQLVCLNADTRTGLMGPGAIYATELEFLALAPGYLSMEAVRVTDLENGAAVDIRDLPDVMAMERS